MSLVEQPESEPKVRKTRSVAILRADHIGDLVLTTSLMQALAAGGWHVDIVGQQAVVLLENCEYVRTTETLPNICPQWPRDWKKLSAWLRARNYDATIVPFCRPLALLRASAAAGVRQRIAMGTSVRARLLANLTGHQFFATNFVGTPRPYYETMVKCATPLVTNPSLRKPRITLTTRELTEGESLLSSRVDGVRRIGVHPCCLGNTCNLPIATYRELVEMILRETNASVIVTGSREDRLALADWRPLAADHPRRLWICAGDIELRLLAVLIARLDAFVVPSTGPLHVAHAIGAKTISPFCPQAPVCASVWGYQPYDQTTVQPTNPPCDPARPHGGNCDFRGSITARDLMNRLNAILPAE